MHNVGGFAVNMHKRCTEEPVPRRKGARPGRGVCVPPPRHVLQPSPSYSWSCLRTAAWRLRLSEKGNNVQIFTPRAPSTRAPRAAEALPEVTAAGGRDGNGSGGWDAHARPSPGGLRSCCPWAEARDGPGPSPALICGALGLLRRPAPTSRLPRRAPRAGQVL